MFEASGEEVERLQVGQNRAMRFILGVGRETKILVMLEELGWLCIELLILYSVLVLIFKLKKGLLWAGEEWTDCIKGKNKGHKHNLRDGGKIRVEIGGILDSTIFYRGMREYNKMKVWELENCELAAFKKRVKIRLMEYQRENWDKSRLIIRRWRDGVIDGLG